MLKKFIIGLWTAFALGLLAIFLYFFSVTKGWVGYVPDMSEIADPEYKFASQVFTADGVSMGTWSLSKENRVFVEYDSISPDLVRALIATEDVRFKEHSGIDAKSLVRAVVKTGILRQENAGGGSTITQQLAKLLYTEVSGSTLGRITQKPIEWVIAVQLERLFTKEEIISLYLNKYDFGNNAVGIKSAANVYFGKSPARLSVEEAATLVGMCKNSSLYNPRRRNEKTRERRNVVLMQMEKAGYLTAEEKDSLSALPLVLDYHPADHKSGIATYFREYLRIYMSAKKPDKSKYRGWQMQKYYEDSLNWEQDPLYGWCNKNTKPDGSNYSIYTDGLKIYTTIDSRMQTYLEEAVEEHMVGSLQPRFFKAKKGKKTAPFTENLKTDEVEEIMKRAMKQSDRYRTMKKSGYSEEEIVEAFNTPREMKVFTYEGMKDSVMTPMDSLKYNKFFLRTGVVSMDPLTGEVKAYVGGTDYNQFKYDMAGVGRRQVGSTIKPFLYSLAMEHGFSPCDETQNVRQTIVTENGQLWSPRNSSKQRIGETVTLRWGLQTSNNWISAYLMSKLSPYSLKKLIHQFGLLNKDIQPVPSLCLGPCEASVIEMVSAYTAFVGKGIRTAPLMVTRIEDNAGNVIATFTARKNEVISEESSYKMIEMLRAVVNEGTGTRIRRDHKINADMGGKTGTTNNNADGWFMGFTPSLVTGCWVGGEERDIHFDRMADGQGASMALPIWGIYMNKVYADKSLPYSQEEKFDVPEDFDPCGSTLLKTEVDEESAGEENKVELITPIETDEVSDDEDEGFADFFN
ncbi:MAG: transglycosylase domain-containing protein [Bacteroidaceae bacterium]|nr:transglycosylase domain-containing protein [Bacteroidaceae bacterium]